MLIKSHPIILPQFQCNRMSELQPGAAPGSPAALSLYLRLPAYVWFACNFDYLSFCGWTREGGSGAEWLIQPPGTPTVHRGPAHDHTGRTPPLTFILRCCCCCCISSSLPGSKVFIVCIFPSGNVVFYRCRCRLTSAFFCFRGTNGERREDRTMPENQNRLGRKPCGAFTN